MGYVNQKDMEEYVTVELDKIHQKLDNLNVPWEMDDIYNIKWLRKHLEKIEAYLRRSGTEGELRKSLVVEVRMMNEMAENWIEQHGQLVDKMEALAARVDKLEDTCRENGIYL